MSDKKNMKNDINVARLPESWSGVTVRQLADLVALADEGLPPLDAAVASAAILLGCDDEDVLSLPPGRLAKALSRLRFLDSLPSAVPPTTVEVGGRTYALEANAAQLVLGAWADLERLMGDHPGARGVHHVCSILYRPQSEAGGPEPYDARTRATRAELFLDYMPADAALAAHRAHLEFRARFYKVHEAQFVLGGGEEEEDVTGEDPRQRALRQRKEEAERVAARRAMWMDYAMELACGDPLRVRQALLLPVQEAFYLRGLQIRHSRRHA